MMGIIVSQIGHYYVISRTNMKAMEKWKFKIFDLSVFKYEIWGDKLQFTVPEAAEIFISCQYNTRKLAISPIKIGFFNITQEYFPYILNIT